jgi:hypothetical protein
MAMPVVDKVWNYGVANAGINIDLNSLGSNLADCRQLMRRMVTEAIARGAVCMGSSDGTTAGLDGVNRWDADAKLIWASGAAAHSWMALKFPSVHATFCVVLDLNNAQSVLIDVAVSDDALFTGGTTTARPTAANEHVHLNDAQWIGIGSGAFDCALNVVASTDGEVFRMFAFRGNALFMYFEFGKVKNPIAQWLNPSYALVGVGTAIASTLTYGNLYAAVPTQPIRSRVVTALNSVATVFGLATTGIGATALGQAITAVHPVTLEYPLTGVNLYTTTALRGPGVYGGIFDFHFASTTPGDGDVYPNPATPRTHLQIQDVIIPWPDVAPLLS